jgi:hypothetical protein
MSKDKDWLTELNQIADARWPIVEGVRTYDQQTRDLVEAMLVWAQETKNGHSLVEWLKRKQRLGEL